MKQSSVIPIKIGNVLINMIDLYDIISTDTLTPMAHAHEFFEMHIILDGYAQIQIMEKTYKLQSGNLIVIPPHFAHLAITKSSNYKSMILAFDFSSLDKTTKNKYECEYFMSAFTLNNVQILKMSGYDRTRVNLLLKNAKKYDIYSVNKINIEISGLMLELANKIHNLSQNKIEQTTTISSNETAVRKYKIELYVQQCINNNQKLSLQDLANALYISTRQVERFIKQSFNLTFKQLCLKYQMIIAKNLLKEGNLSVEKIAYKVGFESYNGFLAAYKKYYGTLPTTKSKNILTKNNLSNSTTD